MCLHNRNVAILVLCAIALIVNFVQITPHSLASSKTQVTRRSSASRSKYQGSSPEPGKFGEEVRDESMEEDSRVFMGYTDSWVVELEGGRDEADRLAEKYGFINLGQVGVLEGVFHLALWHSEEDDAETAKRIKEGQARNRSGTSLVNKMQEKSAELNTEHHVSLSTQQKAFRKEKRDVFTYPSDPYWYYQWALLNENVYGKRGNDLNVVSVWIQGYTGSGVAVSVVDDGLQSSHPDLSRNFDSTASFNYVESVSDPSPFSVYDSHGTSCAGEIGMARDNDYCGVGVAYNCKLGGIRVDLNYLTDVTEAEALSYQNDYVQIYSNSWGPPDNGFLVQGPGYYSGRTLKEGAAKGRNGLGSIWVWASGNGGRNDDSCAADGYASSIYTIAVGSADPIGTQAYYDEACSGKMAVTFSYSSNGYTQLVTTSTQSRCVSTFTGTSASAPLTAGVIALVLESNPNLSWRDIQYLIAYTSNPTPFQFASGWITNGAGLLVSHQFGFGAIDAEAMVTRAQHWTSVPQQRSCTVMPTSNTYATTDKPLTIQFSISSSECNVAYLEHVVVQMTLSITVKYGGYYSYDDYFDNPSVMYHDGPRRGNILVELYSPQGTKSVLLPERQNDFVNNDGYNSWPFMSILHWGENPVGDWTITVQFSSDKGYVTMGNLAVVLYGSNQVPESVKQIPDECNSECVRGCAAQGEKFCDSCKHRRMMTNLRCVSSCPGEEFRSTQDFQNESSTDMSGSCSVGGYCMDCRQRLLLLSVPMIVLITLSGLVVLVGSIFISYVLWSKLCRVNNDYISI